MPFLEYRRTISSVLLLCTLLSCLLLPGALPMAVYAAGEPTDQAFVEANEPAEPDEPAEPEEPEEPQLPQQPQLFSIPQFDPKRVEEPEAALPLQQPRQPLRLWR